MLTVFLREPKTEKNVPKNTNFPILTFKVPIKLGAWETYIF